MIHHFVLWPKKSLPEFSSIDIATPTREFVLNVFGKWVFGSKNIPRTFSKETIYAMLAGSSPTA